MRTKRFLYFLFPVILLLVAVCFPLTANANGSDEIVFAETVSANDVGDRSYFSEYRAICQPVRLSGAGDGSPDTLDDYLAGIFGNCYNIVSSTGSANGYIDANIRDYHIPLSSMKEVGIGFVQNHPELFWLATSVSGSYSTNTNEMVVLRIFTTMTQGEAISAIPEFERAADSILGGVKPEMTEAQALLYIHDSLANLCSYDYTYSMRSAYHALVKRSAVCQGYSLAFNYLASRLGFETAYIATDDSTQIGLAQNHGWSVVKIGEMWYHVDVTHDDPTRGTGQNEHGLIAHGCFLASDEGIRKMQIAISSTGEKANRVFVTPDWMTATDTGYENLLTAHNGASINSGFAYWNGQWFVSIFANWTTTLWTAKDPFDHATYSVAATSAMDLSTCYPYTCTFNWRGQILTVCPDKILLYDPYEKKTTVAFRSKSVNASMACADFAETSDTALIITAYSFSEKKWIAMTASLDAYSTDSVSGVIVNRDTLTLRIGEQSALSAFVIPTNSSFWNSILWRSENERVASVTYDGKVTGLSSGQAQILAFVPTAAGETTGGQSGACTVSVSAQGKCGKNLTWSLDNGTLRISGTGAMEFENAGLAPWINDSPTITAIELPEGLTSIPEMAFSGCFALREILLPSTLRQIGNDAFLGCDALQSFAVAEENPIFKAIDGVLFADGGKKLLQYPMGKTDASYILPDVTEIISSAAFFKNSHLKEFSVSFSSSLRSIGDRAFWETNLERAILSPGLTDIGEYAFGFCSSLYEVRFYSSDMPTFGANAFIQHASHLTFYFPSSASGWQEGELSLSDATTDMPVRVMAFLYGKCGENLIWTLVQDVLKIEGSGKMSFEDGKAPWSSYAPFLVAVVLPEGLTSIADYAFADCSNIFALHLPNSVSEIGRHAFDGCSSLSSLVTSVEATYFSTVEGMLCSANGTKLILCPPGCAEQTIVLPDGITEIADYAFESCTTAEAFALNEGNVNFRVTNGVLFSKDGKKLIAYPAAKADADYSLPTAVTSIGVSAFSSNPYLVNLSASSSALKTIGKDAFSGMVSLRKCLLPDDLKTIASQAFSGCASLETVEFYGDFPSIGENAFSGCKAGLTFFRLYSASGWTDGELVLSPTDRATVIPFQKGTSGTNITWRIEGSKLLISGRGQMRAASSFGWTPYLDRITEISVEEGIASLADGAFAGCTGISDFRIPGSLTKVGSGTFDGCKNLRAFSVDSANTTFTSLDGILFSASGKTLCRFPEGKPVGSYSVPEGVETISDDAFRGCESLTVLSLPVNLKQINAASFDGCTALTAFILSEANESYSVVDGVLMSKDETLFVRCPEGRTESALSLPKTLRVIGTRAFAGCKNLLSITFAGGKPAIENSAFEDCSDALVFLVPFDGEGWSEGTLPIDDNASVLVSLLYQGDCGQEMEWKLEDGKLTVSGEGEMDFEGSAAPWVVIADKIESIQLSDKVETIAPDAFIACSNLKSIEVDEENLFFVSIEGVLLNKTVTTLYCYPQGKPETDYIVPAPVITIAHNAFAECANLQALTFNGDKPDFDETAFAGCASNLTFYAPFDAEGWIEGPITIADGVTANVVLLYQGKCGANLTWNFDGKTLTVDGTGEMDFFGESTAPWATVIGQIQTVVLPEALTLVAPGAFEGCSNLTNVRFSGDIPVFGAASFKDCGEGLTFFYHPGKAGWSKGMQTFGENENAFTAKVIPFLPYDIDENGKTDIIDLLHMAISIQSGETAYTAEDLISAILYIIGEEPAA